MDKTGLKVNLLGKTEIRIEQLKLERANLNVIAAVVAEVLGLKKDEVMVTDVKEGAITIDILRRTIYAEQVYGKKNELLRELSKVSGVTITGDAAIHSEGVLGLIALDENTAKEVIQHTKQIGEEVKSNLSKRAIVFATGADVRGGMLEDTNTPTVVRRLKEEGYRAVDGPTLEDDEEHIAGHIRRAVDDGYGLIIITGGVGAEDKDRTVEGIQKVDPGAATPYLIKYEKGTGRHKKDGVRIAVGEVAETLIIALPGPNDEVQASIEAIIGALRIKAGKEALANEIAKVLREKLKAKASAVPHQAH